MAALACGLSLLAAPTIGAAAAETVPPPPGIPAAPHVPSDPRRAAGDEARDAASHRSKEWQQALRDARRPDMGELWAPRPLAAIIGVGWFAITIRRRLGRRRRGRAA